jgi:Flp pilus assembly protein TadB
MLQVLSILAILIALGCLIYLLTESLRNWLSAWRQIRQTKKENKKLEKYRRAEEKRQRSPQTTDAAGALMERNEDADIRRDIARVGYVLLFVWEAFLILPLAWGVIFGGPAWSPPTLLHLLRVTVGYPLVVYLLWRMVLWTLGRFARST